MQTILITGGTGMLGTYLSSQLLEMGYKVIIMGRTPKTNLNTNLSYATWNLEAQTIDENAIKQADVIVNLAGANVGTKRWTASRKKEIVCVVETIRDVIAIESTQQFNGLYHVLGGVISPLDGVGPDQLTIDSLLNRLKTDEVEELIFALSPNIQGDTTLFYITKKLKELPVKITTISRGISFGGELEYADELTLARSIQNRQPADQYVGMKS
jgi:recombination protein RecR